MHERSPRRRAVRFGLPLWLVLAAAACRPPAPYPEATVQDFLALCRREMWLGEPAEARADEFCRCVLRACNDAWNADEFNRIMVRSASGGWGRGFLGLGSEGKYPRAMQAMMARCKTAADTR